MQAPNNSNEYNDHLAIPKAMPDAITVAELLAKPQILQACQLTKWSKMIKANVAESLRNRPFIDAREMTTEQSALWEPFWTKVSNLVDTDKKARRTLFL
eukprot:CAMPEP_0184991584 /NCGR_PEP_ID=MMETSP1098-20130426/37266_1 /TAXON_ID=89044 /ORGANISM="Spumella elongata, Strain CCAP 955/1" /LENGTH=98 /DNA_ID=CAMNT_0027517031 /DNA_START=49 /DNA_END=345 /DNA_ORIENTATION=+